MGEPFTTACTRIEARPTGPLERTGGRNLLPTSPAGFFPPLLRDGVAAESFPYASVNRGADHPWAATNSS